MLGFGAIGQFAIGQGPNVTAETVTVDKWYTALSIPPRFPIGLKASQQQFASLPDPFPFITIGWYTPLSTPSRVPIGLKPSQQQFRAQDTAVIPVSQMSPWFTPLSMPPRFPIGLKPPQQQFEARPPRLLPNPNITGVMKASESGDTFLGGGSIFNRVVSGEAGVFVERYPSGESGVARVPAPLTSAGVSAVTTTKSAGTSVLPAFRASVSIVVL